MKKQCYVILAVAAVLLSGCQMKKAATDIVKAEVDFVKDGVNFVKDNATSKMEKETKAEETEKEEKVGESAAEEEKNEPQEKNISQLQVGLAYNYKGEWNESVKRQIFTIMSEDIHVLNDGYDVLNNALERWNMENFQTIEGYYQEMLPSARDLAEDDVNVDWSINRSIVVTRADEKILSFWNDHDDYLGGAHGGYYRFGENFDPETGELLTLREVVTDYDKFYEAFLKELTEENNPEMFFQGWEDVVKAMFENETKNDGNELEWTMDQTGVTVCLNPYAIAAWAAGRIDVKVSFDEYPELFKTEYIVRTESHVTPLAERQVFTLDSGEKISFFCTAAENSFDNKIDISKEREGSTLTLSRDVHGTLTKAYVLENKDGKAYLYAEFSAESDNCMLEVFDLGENFCYVGNAEASFCGVPMTNTEEFALCRKIYLMGTYTGYKIYHVGEDGLPVTNDQDFKILNLRDSFVYELKTTRDLNAKIIDGKEEVIPAGTSMKIFQTDEKSYALMQLSDGRICEFSVTKADNQYEWLINGVSEYECFEMLPYAG